MEYYSGNCVTGNPALFLASPLSRMLGSSLGPIGRSTRREWNDRYRDAVRRYWRGDADASELRPRLLGSPDLFSPRGPSTSINFVTAHDGFTLRDLVSYDHKHNEANGEQNRDGSSHNNSANHGVEGETTDPAIRALRLRQIRNLIATLVLSHGTPMLLQGDEVGHTQRGNNNGYCQDNEISWRPWDLDTEARTILDWTLRCLHFRRGHLGLADDEAVTPQVVQPPKSTIAFGLHYQQGGSAAVILFNPENSPVDFVLPSFREGWYLALDSARPDAAPGTEAYSTYTTQPRSTAAFAALIAAPREE